MGSRNKKTLRQGNPGGAFFLFVKIPVLSRLSSQQIDCHFQWIRPAACLNCNHFMVWGHGFVPRYFDGFVSCLYMKCYRCPLCRCVMTSRPDTHFSRILCCKETIRTLLALRITAGRWLRSSLSLPRMRHWLANLKRHGLAHLTSSWKEGLITAFDRLLDMRLVPVSRSM